MAEGMIALWPMYRELKLPCGYLLLGAVAAGAGARAVVDGAAGSVAGGGATNSFLAFFQSSVTPQPHGTPTNSHAKITSITGVFFD